MEKALETETRELLQKEVDKAIYARRNSAVEQKRKIKENDFLQFNAGSVVQIGIAQQKTMIATQERPTPLKRKKVKSSFMKKG